MKVTFPHLGSMHIFCKAIAETAGIPYIVPPETSRKTLTLGVLHSNESICLPFKLILGNFIEALQMGADTIARKHRAEGIAKKRPLTRIVL